MTIARIAAAGCALTLCCPVAARSQALPTEPVSFGGGRLVVSGHAAVSMSSDQDDPGWFNYTDYEDNALRLVRLGMTAAFKAADRVTVLGEVRTENWSAVRPYALYVRVRPWLNRSIDVQAGRIPPTFGAFARRAYETDNPLIGYPLAYQYLAPVRTDALPRSTEELLSQRGRGWLVSYSLGSPAAESGLPLVSAFRWDTGVQVRVGGGPAEASFAVTAGSLGEPRVRDDNDGRQVAVRVALRPSAAWVVGFSGARGAYLSSELDPVLPPGRRVGEFTQRAAGADVEYSAGYWLFRAETILSAWNVPAIGDLRALAWTAETRYKVRPGCFVAGRFDRLTFSEVTLAGASRTWDAPVTRVEAGGGYYVRRNVLAKLVYQHNWRDSDLYRSLGMVAGQVGYWF